MTRSRPEIADERRHLPGIIGVDLGHRDRAAHPARDPVALRNVTARQHDAIHSVWAFEKLVGNHVADRASADDQDTCHGGLIHIVGNMCG